MTMFVSQTYTLLGWVCLHIGTAVFLTEDFCMYVSFILVFCGGGSEGVGGCNYDLAQLLHTPTAAYAFKELGSREG